MIGVEHTRKGGWFLLAQLGASRIISRLTERGVVSQRFVFCNAPQNCEKDCEAN
jgi:hypothetical protein